MSVAIGILGEEFCLLFADSRCIIAENGIATIKDDARKIYRLNKELAFAVVGTLNLGEEIDAPFSTANRVALNVDTARKQVVEYICNSSYSEHLPKRTYIIGGKDLSGNLCIKYVRNDGSGNIECDEVIYPDGGEKMSLWLPPKLEPNKDYYTERLTKYVMLNNGTTIQARIHRFVKELAADTQTINTNVRCEWISKD